MSIYSTLWHLQFPRDGDACADCEWVDVLAQGVPAVHDGAVGRQDNGIKAVQFTADPPPDYHDVQPTDLPY